MRPVPIRRITAKATCEMTRTLRRRLRPKPSVPRSPSFRDLVTTVLDARNAGASPEDQACGHRSQGGEEQCRFVHMNVCGPGEIIRENQLEGADSPGRYQYAEDSSRDRQSQAFSD